MACFQTGTKKRYLYKCVRKTTFAAKHDTSSSPLYPCFIQIKHEIYLKVYLMQNLTRQLCFYLNMIPHKNVQHGPCCQIFSNKLIQKYIWNLTEEALPSIQFKNCLAKACGGLNTRTGHSNQSPLLHFLLKWLWLGLWYRDYCNAGLRHKSSHHLH